MVKHYVTQIRHRVNGGEIGTALYQQLPAFEQAWGGSSDRGQRE
jgi:hypothetical protein